MNTRISGNVPHFGLIVAVLANNAAQVSLVLEVVQAVYKFFIFSDCPHSYVIEKTGKEVMAFLGIGPTQADIEVELIESPAALYFTKVPQKANEVLVEPVLLFMDISNVLVTILPVVQLPQIGSPEFGGKDALTNKRSPDVQALGGGKVCAKEFAERKITKTKR